VKLPEAQENQREFDERYWDVGTADSYAKLQHITFHLGIAIGKLSRYCERHEHGSESDAAVVRDEVTPDLLIYALQLANLTRVDLAWIMRE
jgi:hypothetical protein